MALTKIITDTIDLSSDTTGLKMPKGTTAERQIEYLVVAGGGGGAGSSNGGGGGGAGGLLSGTTDMIATTNLTITVGTGGAGATNETSAAVGGDGGNSVFDNITATGGGGAANTGASSSNNGGSGGGASGGTVITPGSGIPQQGNNGGTGSNPTDIGGGGGGAGGVGQPGGSLGSIPSSGTFTGTDGQGGAALSNSITGTAVLYAGGGGGGVCDFVHNVGTPATSGLGGAGVAGTGGNGGQSDGATSAFVDGGNGTTNTGGGGGGGSRSAGSCPGADCCSGGNGGSGIVILRYASKYTLVNNTPGTLTTGVLNGTVGDDKYTTFTAGTGTISGLSFNLEIGTTRENTTTGKMEIYTGAKGWRALQQTGQDVGVVPTNNFNTVIWTSTGGDTDISITGVGFKPDFVWAKSRTDAYNHTLYDSVRGAGTSHWLSSDVANSESSLAASAALYGYLASFDNDGFTGNAGTSDNSYFNYSTSKNYVSWSWKAGGAAVQNNDGSINGTDCMVSANTDAGFSIIKWTGSTSSSSESVGHGLGKAPELVILKNMDATDDWYTYAKGVTGNNQYLKLNTTDAVITAGSDSWGAGPTSSVMGLRPATFSSPGNNIIMYCWTSIPGYSLIGTYTGTDSATDTPIIYTGFEPAWIMVKRTDSTSWWNIQDNKRNTSNPRINVLGANDASAEINSSSYAINFYNNGFQIANSFSDWNAGGGKYLFMCFAS